ncbi:MAG: transcription antitermination factor NusB [Bacteroidales bacterium]|jgi:N utilization substance protein B|nr:transcription antitermination factor NusB [Bacteroidales bacterium]
MISRRLLRIKALLILYAFNRKKGDDLEAADKELLISLKKSYDLYHLLLLLVLEIVDLAEEKIEIARQKKIPTYEDLNPNTKLIENRLLRQLSINKQLKNYSRTAKLSWINNKEIPKIYYNILRESSIYREYMNSGKSSYSEDKKFISRMLSLILTESEELESVLEEKSIYWNDDLDFVSVMVEKTLRQFRETDGEDHKLMDLYRSDEDEVFVKTLLRKTILNTEKLEGLIGSNTTNWEIERIALMDILVMQLAITEIREFPEIPVKVSLNEYIEIAKFYCTSKSSTFVNGILDKIVKEMREKKMFRKTGRGLVGEPGFEETENKEKN